MIQLAGVTVPIHTAEEPLKTDIVVRKQREKEGECVFPVVVY